MLNARSFTPALSRVLAPWVKTNDYLGQDFFRADGAEEAIVTRRQQALDRLANFSRISIRGRSFGVTRFGKASRICGSLMPVEFPFRLRASCEKNSILLGCYGFERSGLLLDIDGHWSLDVTGSYGVNVAGYDQYKEWMQKGGNA